MGSGESAPLVRRTWLDLAFRPCEPGPETPDVRGRQRGGFVGVLDWLAVNASARPESLPASILSLESLARAWAAGREIVCVNALPVKLIVPGSPTFRPLRGSIGLRGPRTVEGTGGGAFGRR